MIIVLIGATFFLITTPAWLLFNLTWHDQQRIFQLALLISSLLIAPWVNDYKNYTPSSGACILLIALTLGALSASTADHPRWGWTDLSLIVGLIALAAAISKSRTYWGKNFDRAAFSAVFLLIFILSTQTIASWVAAIIDGNTLDTWLIISGFSNPRFLGQTVTLIVPVAGAVLLISNLRLRWRLTLAVSLTIFCWLGWLSGSRGSWIAITLAILLAWQLGGVLRLWATWQLVLWTGGLILHILLIEILPDLLGFNVLNDIETRITTSSSGRTQLWADTVKLWQQHPWLGVGPLNFAATHHTFGAHPHNLPLQILVEWGLIGMTAWIGVAFHAGRILQRRMMICAHLPITQIETAAAVAAGGGMSIVAALILSLVDGVHVMPYPQTIWALIVGWWIAASKFLDTPLKITQIEKNSIKTNRNQKAIFSAALLFITWGSAGWLFNQLLSADPWLSEPPCEAPCIEARLPRFWARGWLGS